jgi:hypothetical protein
MSREDTSGMYVSPSIWVIITATVVRFRLGAHEQGRHQP